MQHPTLLCIPACWHWTQVEEQHVLPLDVQAYRVSEEKEGWKVRTPDGALIYFGPGPARVKVSPAPF